MMKKISAITFHASYNYGSCLQAYALQEYVKKICNEECVYKIINLRTPIQKNMYKSCFEKKGIENYLKRIMSLKQKKNIILRKEKFEKFINEKLNITDEYNSLNELKEIKWNSDYFITGSDQVWNIKGRDFNWSYFLEFVNTGKKISYAASLGPTLDKWNDEEKERVKKDLLKFDYISVRDNSGMEFVNKLLGVIPEINVDPTMLLSEDEWNKIIPKEPLVQGEYIFLYNLKGEEYIKLAKEISKILNLPVVISLYNAKDIIYGFRYGFIKKVDSGPIEFLNLIKNAKLVLSSSFHGTIFSIILKKPFFALNGNNDFRISTILRKMDLEKRSINAEDFVVKCKDAYKIDYTNSEKLLEEEKNKSNKYLKKALDIIN